MFTKLFYLTLVLCGVLRADNTAPIVPCEVTEVPSYQFIGTTQFPAQVEVGDWVSVTWKFEASGGLYRPQYHKGDPVPQEQLIQDWGITGWGPIGGSGGPVNYTTMEVARRGVVANWRLGTTYYYDPCDRKRKTGSSALSNTTHHFILKPAPPNTSPEPPKTEPGPDPIPGPGPGGDPDPEHPEPVKRPDQGEAELSGEVVTSYIIDPDRGQIPRESNAFQIIEKTDLSDIDSIGRNDVDITVVHRIVTIDSPEPRDLEGDLKITLLEGQATDYEIYQINPENGQRMRLTLPATIHVTEPGHNGGGIHDWHGGTERLVFRRIGDSSLKLKFTVKPTEGISIKTATLDLLPVEVITDMNNDGDITAADSQAREASYGPLPPLTQEIVERGTEFLFRNDQRSNGLWDGEDRDPDKPAAEKDDDDAQEIKIDPGITEGEVWLEHPAIAVLSFYKTRECKDTEKVNLSTDSRFTVSSSNPFPNQLFIRAEEGTLTFPPANPQIEGDLVLKIKVGGENGQEIEVQKMRLTIVEELGAEKYFHAARDYILENNTKYFKHRKGYAGTAYSIVAMREESTMMFALDAYDHTTDQPGLKGIDAVKVNYEADVIINGNQCFKNDGIGASQIPYPGGMTDRCDGRLCIGGLILRPPSDDTHSPALGGTGARYVGVTEGAPSIINGQIIQQKLFTFSTGRVPEGVPATPDQGIGGLTASYDREELQEKENQVIGRAPVTESGKGIVFTATNPADLPGNPILLAADAHSSGVKPLAGGAPGTLELLFLDGSSSVGLVLANPDGVQKTLIKGAKHDGMYYYINTYLLFECEMPR